MDVRQEILKTSGGQMENKKSKYTENKIDIFIFFQ